MSTPLSSSPANGWVHLAPNPKSAYKQLFIKNRRIRAEAIYGLTVDCSEPITPEQVATSFDLPLEAVQEAIDYCRSNPPEIEADHRREEARMKATGMSDPGYQGTPRQLSPQELAQLRNS